MKFNMLKEKLDMLEAAVDKQIASYPETSRDKFLFVEFGKKDMINCIRRFAEEAELIELATK